MSSNLALTSSRLLLAITALGALSVTVSGKDFDIPTGAPRSPTFGAAPFTEATSYAPSSPYAASKAGSDHLVRAWGRTYGLPVVVSNCSNNYGPRQFPEKLIPHMILNALAGRPLLFIRGELSDLLAPKTFAEMRRRLPDAESVTAAKRA